jgi:hypothetical protein
VTVCLRDLNRFESSEGRRCRVVVGKIGDLQEFAAEASRCSCALRILFGFRACVVLVLPTRRPSRCNVKANMYSTCRSCC